MKTKKSFLPLLTFMTAFTAMPCLARVQVTSVDTVKFEKGGADAGGGDICEDRFKIIRDTIQNWIRRGGSKNLALPSGVTVRQYNKTMLLNMKTAKIRCVGERDDGYPVKIDNTPKVCRFDKLKTGNLITCDFKKFNETENSDQFVLVHHEYAGLTGFEPPNSDESTYAISNQISDFYETVEVGRLATHKRPSPKPQDIETNFGAFAGVYEVVSCERLISEGDSNKPQSRDCHFPYARLFLGDDYAPREPKDAFYINFYRQIPDMADSSKGFVMGMELAFILGQNDALCTTFSGNQMCSSKTGGYITKTEINDKNGFVYLKSILNWPDPASYLYSDLAVVLKKVR